MTVYFLRATTGNPNTGGTIRDLSDAQGADSPIASSPNADNAFLTTARWRTPTLDIDLASGTVPTSLDITGMNGSNIFRWRINRLDSGGSIAASSSWSTERSTTGVHTHTFTDAPTGTPYAQLEIEFQSARDGGMPASQSVTVGVSDPDSTVEVTAAAADPVAPTLVAPADEAVEEDGLSYTWTFQTDEPGLSQEAFAFRARTADGVRWWNGSAWSTTEVWIESTDETLTLPAGAWDTHG